MDKVTIWHNPQCSKSRAAMEILKENKLQSDVVKYLKDTPSITEIKNVLNMLGLSARELMRTKEDIYKELDLANENDEEKLIEAMAKNPKLIERPIIIKGNKAIIGRPTERIAEFLNS
jgi:arsenate reductase